MGRTFTPEMETKNLFSIQWLGIAFILGLAIQLTGWIMGVGLLTGLPAYFIIGIITAWGSPGRTLAEPAIASFCIAAAGFIINHLYLTILGIGLPLALLYGITGLAIALIGAWIGETYLD